MCLHPKNTHCSVVFALYFWLIELLFRCHPPLCNQKIISAVLNLKKAKSATEVFRQWQVINHPWLFFFLFYEGVIDDNLKM